MADLDATITLRFEGIDAANHEIDLFAFGECLKGIARISATAGHFAATQEYSKYFISHSVRVVAREPRSSSFSIDIFWNFVQQHQLLSGSFGAISATLIPYVISVAAGKRAEMRLLKEALDNAIRELGNKDATIVARLLDIVEKMAIDLKPSVRQAVAPVGSSCKTLTIESQNRSHTFDEADKAAIMMDKDDELTEVRGFTVLITEMDLERGSCKVRIENEDSNKRFPANITDPSLEITGNAYVSSFAAQEVIDVKAKALVKDGEVARLYISDTGT